MKVGLIIPTLNAGPQFVELLKSIEMQDLAPHHKLIIDSASEDATTRTAESFGYEVISIRRADFDHGATRNIGLSLPADIEILVFLTQDVILANRNSLSNLLAVFADPQVGAGYGRQLPHLHAGAIAAHARMFNYREVSYCCDADNARARGIKAVFMSNSFAAYRRTALEEVGGFPNRVILGEDTCVAAKMILSGWKISYSAEAAAYHSHDYTLWQETRRYFDIGAFHASESWILGNFGAAGGEGRKYVISELKYLWNTGHYALILCSLMRNAAKLLAYHSGRRHKYYPSALKRRLSLNKNFWLE